MAGNAVGSMTADALLEVRTSQLDELDRQLSEQTLQSIVHEASENIVRLEGRGWLLCGKLQSGKQNIIIIRAIIKTKEELKRGVNSPQELLRHFKFVGKQQPTELSRAREIYEESLRLVKKHVELGE